jgi:hypothetical protein
MTQWTAIGFFRSPIIMTADGTHGGAVSSLVWGNYQFINAQDNGRLWQTALQYDGQGEDNNPTEGGSQFDKAGTSSTHVLAESAVGSTLTGTVQAALWHPINGNLVSDTVLSKTIQIGWDGVANLIHDHIVVQPGSNHASAAIEVLTTYLPPEFFVLRSFDPASGAFSGIIGDTNQHPLPTNDNGHDAIIAETPDGQHAIGIWSTYGIQLGALFLAGGTLKIDGGWTDISNLQAGGSYGFDVVVAIGNIADVAAALHQEWLITKMITDVEQTMYAVPPTPAELSSQFLLPQIALATQLGLNPTVGYAAWE